MDKKELLMDKIKRKDAKAFTHGGKFHADDVFSSALLLYFNPEIQITRENQVPEDYEGIVYDIGRGEYDHHQKDSRVRENGIAYAAFGLLWEQLGAEILGQELAEKFDESFVQPLDQNDNTGEKNELASLIGSFNPAWDAKGSNDDEFFQAVSMAGMILESKFERFRGNERADRKIEEILEAHDDAVEAGKEDERILILPEFVPCQKRLSETEIAFVIFPSNRGGYCIQPQKKEFSMNYKCSFPEEWLGLEGEELKEVTGLCGAGFCHKGGFIMSTETMEDAVKACEISLVQYVDEPAVVCVGEWEEESEELLHMLPGMKNVTVHRLPVPDLPEIEWDGIYGEVALEKQEWKKRIKGQVKEILKFKPEAVCVNGDVSAIYPVVHALRKNHIQVLALVEKEGKKLLIRIPSGS